MLCPILVLITDSIMNTGTQKEHLASGDNWGNITSSIRWFSVLSSFPARIVYLFSSMPLLFLLTHSFLPPFNPHLLLLLIFHSYFPFRSFMPTCASPSPCLHPSLHLFAPLSPVIPGSVSASRLSALKLSQRRSVAGRNPTLRGNYLPHGLRQHTQTHIHRL